MLDKVNFNCPYCEKLFGEFPKRKMRCPVCGETIVIKYTPDNRVKRLMTLSQADEAERQWVSYYARQASIRTIQPFGFAEDDLEACMALGNTEDEAVSLFLVSVSENDPNLYNKKIANHQLALLEAKNQRTFQKFLTEAAKCELRILKAKGIQRVQIMKGDAACADCWPMIGKVFDIDDALRTNPIPFYGCMRKIYGNEDGFCICWYAVDLESWRQSKRKL